MKQLKAWFIPALMIAALFTSSGNAVAGVVAIVNKANISADKETIGKLYSTQAKSWAGDTTAKLFDQSDEKLRDAFCQTYAGKAASIIKSSWAKAVFSGRGVPPKMLDSDADVKAEVAKNKDAVGYIDESSADGSVRIVR